MDEDNTFGAAPQVEYYKRFYGDVEIVGKATFGVIMTSLNGTKYRMTVSNAGAPVFTAI